MQIEEEESQFNRLFILKSRINFQKFYKIVLSSREFCKKKIILIKTGMIQTLKGKFPTRVANSSQPLATRSTLIKVFDAELKAKPCNKVGN